MVQIGVLVVAVLAGLLAHSWRQAWIAVVVTFAATTAVQTPLVIRDDDIESPFVYWSVQVLTLLVGLGLARGLHVWRMRRRSVAMGHDR